MSAKANRISRILGIDFETANRTRSSACSLGLCVLDFPSGEVLEKKQFLINPNVQFDYFNTLVNGITPDMVKDAPLFQDVVGEISSRLIHNTIVVAHNAPFDISVLRNSCDVAHIPVPELNYFCTLRLSRSLLPRMSTYTLPAVAEKCGLSNFHHHLADDDAEICAKIFLYLINMCNAETIHQFSLRSGVWFGHTYADGSYSSCHKTREPKIDLPDDDSDVLPECSPISPNENNPLFGKTVVFTGALCGMPRAEAENIVAAAGGIVGKGVTKKTNLIVCGYQDPVALKGHEKSSKLLKAEQYAADGQDIQIVPEEDFQKMIQ